jgi:seryl-tRNA synthetase
MHDIKAIRANPQNYDTGWMRRGSQPESGRILHYDTLKRKEINEIEELQALRNVHSVNIGDAMKSGNKARAESLKSEVAKIKEKIVTRESGLRILDEPLNALLSSLPNLPLDEVPDGRDEHGNVEQHRWGNRPGMNFKPKQHFELGEALGQMDFEAAARMSGARFTLLRNDLARLERALAQLMLDIQTEKNGYTECSVPLLVNDNAVYGTNQLPKFAEDLFRTTDGRWLIPTAEVSLTNSVREQILDEAALPMRLTACTPCFRSEAGAAGRDTRGMIRQHQFTKVELVSITTPEQGRAELDRMTQCAESILQALGLHYRVMKLCAGDMGFGARITYDIEVWLPGQDAFREISSCSYCGDFQARRMEARYKSRDGMKYVHTLNGSGLAVGRTLVAVLENYQNEDGSITVPEALRPYMGGRERIAKA